ncbi:retrovirus-related pol polyprotein from transposon TNT 1-94 [Tanacetum coccineum]
MQAELNHIVANDVCNIVPPPKNQTVIGTKWILQKESDENGVVSRNKARLVAQGYNQQECTDLDETYALVARLESIRILLAYACANDFKLFQMDVKSAFLNGFINEEVYVSQPPRGYLEDIAVVRNTIALFKLPIGSSVGKKVSTTNPESGVKSVKVCICVIAGIPIASLLESQPLCIEMDH